GMMGTMRRVSCLAALSALVLSASCGLGIPCGVAGRERAPAPAKRVAFANWPTFHRTTDRTGRAVAPVGGRVSHAWSKSLSGSVYGEPLIVRGRLIVATERNNVYSLNPRTGHVQWRVHLGRPAPQAELPCG